MKWSLKIGEIAGIVIYLHITFLILIACVGFSPLAQGEGLNAAINRTAFLMALFGCVLLHELGHSLTAKRFGIQVRDITLLPIGGVARLERMPDEPKQELLVAVAGPLVNVAIAFILFLSNLLMGKPWSAMSFNLVRGDFFSELMWVNFSLAFFNLLPAFPMDGGRILRAYLAQKINYVRATQIAANIGQGMAILFGILGLFFNPFLLFIALFVYMGAASESHLVQMRSTFQGLPLHQAMVTDFRSLSVDDPLSKAIEHLLSGYQQDFPVLDQAQNVVGILTKNDLILGLSQKGQAAMVSEVMRRDFGSVDPFEMLERVFQRMQSCNCPSLPVVHQGKLVGMITLENIGEFMMVQTALKRKGRKRNEKRQS